MSLPDNRLSSSAVVAAMLGPDAVGREGRLVDYERGGIALSDPTQGLDVQDWRLRLVGTQVRVAPAPYSAETTLFSEAGITELSLAFDQNMRPAVAYVAGGAVKLYWYDTVAAAQVTTVLASDVTSPFLTLDDKRASQVQVNDILLFYVRAGSLRYRQQRDRYTIERTLAAMPAGFTRINRVGMATNLRLQIELATA